MLHNKYEKIPKHISEEPHSRKCESGWFTYQFYYVVKILTFTSHMANEKKHLHTIFFQHIKNIVLYFGCDNLQLEGCKHTHRTGVAENRVHAKPTTVTQTWHPMFSFIVFKNQYVFIYSPHPKKWRPSGLPLFSMFPQLTLLFGLISQQGLAT